MGNFIAATILAIITVAAFFKILTWRKLYVAAKSTEFPVFLSPVHITDIWWLLLHPVLVPILDLLPNPSNNPWLSLAQVWKIWKFGYTPFQNSGSDTVVLTTPQGNLLWTCDPKICRQLETRPQSQLDVNMVKFFEVYGPTVGSVEGDEWKGHRKVITSGFNAATHAAVWKETTQQTGAMIACWMEQGSDIAVVKDWTCRLALHVISGVFFRKKLAWDEDHKGDESLPPGHELRYDQALFTVLARLGTLYVTPRALLGLLPIKVVREAHLAFTEWTKYMQELQVGALDQDAKISATSQKSILESIVLAGQTDQNLPQKSILGNIFFTLLAGHETTGNTMSFTLNLLAIYPRYQHKIREDIDRQRARRPFDQWTVENEFQVLHKGWIGAVLKEVLRLYCVVQFIPRLIKSPIEIVDSKGIRHGIPEKTLCLLNFSAAFQNPNTWTRKNTPAARRTELHDSPAIDFDPSRWLNDDSNQFVESGEQSETSPPLLFPFGQGPRACPGRMFAQIEMTAAIATILKDYDIELVVDERTRKNCGGVESEAWQRTRDQAIRNMMDDIESNISVQLTKNLPVRLTKRSG